MKIRSITVVLLAFLTLLLVLDAWYRPEDPSSRQPSVELEIRPSPLMDPQASRTEVFRRPQAGLTSLVLKGGLGVVKLKSGAGDELVISATITAEREGDLAAFEVVEAASHSELSYELVGTDLGQSGEAGLSFEAEVPSGMEVTVQYDYGFVEVADFVGFLKLVTRFSNVSVQGLQGTLQVDNQFGNVGLHNIAGPLTLESAFSTSRVQLLPVDGGYDFQIEVSNGSLTGNAPVERDVQKNMTTARGKHGDGQHPVVIKSDFGSVTVDLASTSR